MKGNFAGRLGRKDGGATVDARGWIFWNEIDPRIQSIRVAATIAQNEGRPNERLGTGWSEPYHRQNGNGSQRQEWRCDVPEDRGREFTPGAALAGGVLVSADMIWPWGDDPTVD
jgi:hypothetical protein